MNLMIIFLLFKGEQGRKGEKGEIGALVCDYWLTNSSIISFLCILFPHRENTDLFLCLFQADNKGEPGIIGFPGLRVRTSHFVQIQTFYTYPNFILWAVLKSS